MEQLIEIEADANGILVLPPEMTGVIKPYARFIFQRENGQLTLTPKEESRPFWETATPAERAADLRQWALSHKNGPNLPDEALRRENMYE